MKPLAVTLGDPAGIGTEIVFKALAALPEIPIWLFGDWSLTEQALAILGRTTGLEVVSDAAEARGDRLFFDVGVRPPGALRFGVISPDYGRVALASLDHAVNAVERGACSGLVTSPIQKQAIIAAGSPFAGHTELLASRAGLMAYGTDYAMYFDSPTIRVALLTVHVPLTEAITMVSAKRILALSRLLTRDYERLYGETPRIAVAGLNPHAGEGGLMGNEDETIAAGVSLAEHEGLNVSGPFAADTVFLSARRGKFDAVIAIYHDQGLIPVKTLHFDESVNVTLGLPYLRCSVDHGTAFDIAGQGIADATPMQYAINWAARHSQNWMNFERRC